jgi:DNA-binding response OmpR family regulator
MKKTILIIDDDDFYSLSLKKTLGAKFNVVYESDPLQALKIVEEQLPDIIILDVVMPRMSGYEVCKTLKQNSLTKYIPVIFISAHNETADRLNGYDAGGDDYLVKPTLPAELIRKIAILLRNRLNNELLAKRIQSADKVAKLALQSMGDAGIIMNFMRDVSRSPSYIQVAETALDILKTNSLEASIQLRTQNGTISRNLEGVCSPLEESILHTLECCGRIVDLGKRSAFSFKRVTIAINNMPKDDQENYGRIKDLVAILAEAIDIQIDSIDLTLNAIQRGDALLGLLHRNVATFRDIESKYRGQRLESEKILDYLVKSLEDSFMFLGLTESQENYIQKLAHESVDKAQALFEDAYQTDAIMKTLGDGLDLALKQELQGVSVASIENENRIELF